MKKLIHIAALVLLTPVAIAEPQIPANVERCGQYDSASGCIAIRASIINLVATPERFDSKVIQTTGYLVLEFEHMALYLDKESTPDEGVWVHFGDGRFDTDADVDKWQKQYDFWRCQYNHMRVEVRGTFSSEPAGHLVAAYPGSIHIEHIESISPHKNHASK